MPIELIEAPYKTALQELSDGSYEATEDPEAHEKLIAQYLGGEVISLAEHLGVDRAQIELTTQLLDQLIDYSAFHANHSMRVTVATVELAKIMGVDPRQAWIAGMLHDMGKLTIPQELLDPKREFKQTDYQIMKYHAEASFNIVRQYGFSEDIAMVVGTHHKRQLGRDGADNSYGVEDTVMSASARRLRDLLTMADHMDAASRNNAFKDTAALDQINYVLAQDSYRQHPSPATPETIRDLLAATLSELRANSEEWAEQTKLKRQPAELAA